MKNYNKYDFYIFLLIASLVAGNLFGAFQVPRVLALLLVVPCLNGLCRLLHQSKSFLDGLS